MHYRQRNRERVRPPGELKETDYVLQEEKQKEGSSP